MIIGGRRERGLSLRKRCCSPVMPSTAVGTFLMLLPERSSVAVVSAVGV